MEGWRAKTLSQVGKMVLIKAMAAVVPSYAMSTFLLPKSFCRRLDQMFQKLLVGFPSRENQKPISQILKLSLLSKGLGRSRIQENGRF
jgi:hypothetical protein